MTKAPNTKSNLDRCISRYTGNDAIKANKLSVALANAIVAQMINAGVVKGGTSLKFRYGDNVTRVTKDLDTAWSVGLEQFLSDIKSKLAIGWNGFTGEVDILKKGNPKGVPFDYVMQPCSVHLKYLGSPWRLVDLEIGHNEIGDADAFDVIPVPNEVSDLLEFLALPPLGEIKVMKLEYQIAQKLHGATELNSKRAHDLIDLQLICQKETLDFKKTAGICRELFRYRRKQPWPTLVAQNEGWDIAYAEQKGDLSVLPTVGEAVIWVNELIAKIDNA